MPFGYFSWRGVLLTAQWIWSDVLLHSISTSSGTGKLDIETRGGLSPIGCNRIVEGRAESSVAFAENS